MDHLTKTIAAAIWPSRRPYMRECLADARAAAAAIRADRTITTPQAAEALPPESVVMSYLGVICMRGYDNPWLVDGEPWPQNPMLPARVLYRPDEDGA